MIEIVSATRLIEAEFWERSALGRSLRRLAYDSRISSSIAYSNSTGLPLVYNSRILAGPDKEIIVFIHDDVWIDDYFLAERLIDGLKEYDIIGLAGARRRIRNQAVWFSTQTEGLDTNVVLDNAINLSGAVAHGSHTSGGAITQFGENRARCELMDGLFLAARTLTLRSRSVYFDPRFDFHFYDLDFCRTATRQGLRIGTWPIAVTHESTGNINNQWFGGYKAYLEKWGD